MFDDVIGTLSLTEFMYVVVIVVVIVIVMMQVHLVENVKQRDEKYWLPGQPEEAYFCVRV